jgi:hypothetical protein
MIQPFFVVATFAVGDGAADLAVDGTSLWIAASGLAKLLKVDATRGGVVASFDTDPSPYGLTFGPGNQVYVAAAVGDCFTRVPRTAQGSVSPSSS